MADRHKYTHEEIDQYFDRICLPKSQRIHDVSNVDDAAKLTYLNLLQRHQLVKVPWDNFAQHYSWHHVVHLTPRHLFSKIVHQPGRGGYCMEANYFFHLIVYSLGFNVYLGGSRIYRGPDRLYGGWTHVVNIVTIGEARYLLDGGYGGPGPSRPLPLEHGVVSTQVAPAESRLLFEPLAQNLNQNCKAWVYQHRFDEHSPWTPHYCFTDFEFLPEDIRSMNFAPWLDRHSFFTHKVVANRFSTDRETDDGDGPGSAGEVALEGDIDGNIQLSSEVLKWRRRGKKVVELHFQTEAERLAAIKKYFGVTFDKEDMDGITGTAAAVGAMAPLA